MSPQRDPSRARAYARLRNVTMLSGAGAAALAGAVTGWAAAQSVAGRNVGSPTRPAAPLTPAQLMALEFTLPSPPPKQVVIISVPVYTAAAQPAARPVTGPLPAARRSVAPAPALAPPRAVAPVAAQPAATTGAS